jgi:hypothetical protein
MANDCDKPFAIVIYSGQIEIQERTLKNESLPVSQK